MKTACALAVILATVLGLAACKPESERPSGERVIAERALAPAEFRELFAPARLLGPSSYWYHGVRDGMAYVSIVEPAGPESVHAVPGADRPPLVRRYTVPLSAVSFAPLIGFSDWNHRQSLRIQGMARPSGEGLPARGAATYRLRD